MMNEIKIPSAGESITEVQIAEWRKSPGDYVRADEVIVEIETEKASMEVPAPVAGTLRTVLKKAGETARVGEVIGAIEAGVGAPAQGPAPVASASGAKASPARTAAGAASAAPQTGGHVMPAARRALSEHGLSAEQVPASGPGGRLLKEDVQQFAARDAGAASNGDRGGAEEIVPMTLLRRTIAQRLVESQQQAALLTTFNEIDMSAVLSLRQERGDAFEKRYGVKLGFMSFFVKATIDALRQIPQVNAEIRELPGADGKPLPHIVYKNFYDIGVAVSTDRGLVVPVVRHAERLSFAEIERTISDLAVRARERKLGVDELSGGTFTISNGGVFGSLMSTPIINPPQSGILGLHAIQERPVARDGQVVIRPMMYVALTYDHRIVDGRESVTFLKRIKECVEDPARMLLEV